VPCSGTLPVMSAPQMLQIVRVCGGSGASGAGVGSGAGAGVGVGVCTGGLAGGGGLSGAGVAAGGAACAGSGAVVGSGADAGAGVLLPVLPGGAAPPCEPPPLSRGMELSVLSGAADGAEDGDGRAGSALAAGSDVTDALCSGKGSLDGAPATSRAPQDPSKSEMMIRFTTTAARTAAAFFFPFIPLPPIGWTIVSVVAL
jgi:hypothetical protein